MINHRPGRVLERTAVLSPCGDYRYHLTRRWAPGPLEVFCMLNPSTADADLDDPTIRRCMGFAELRGASGIEIVNLFALRTSSSKELRGAKNPIGPDNNMWLRKICRSKTVICAWGLGGAMFNRNFHVMPIFTECNARLTCLRRTTSGHPSHPLYLPYSTHLEDYAL